MCNIGYKIQNTYFKYVKIHDIQAKNVVQSRKIERYPAQIILKKFVENMQIVFNT